MTKLKTNKYGQVDLRSGVPSENKHIPSARYGKIRISNVCGNLGVEYAPALIGFEMSGERWKPIFDGIVVSSMNYQKVMEEAERCKANLIRKCRFDTGVISKEEALPYAVEAIISMNAYISKPRCTDAESREIKDLKKQLIQHLYKRGYCTNVGLHRPYNLITAMYPNINMCDCLAFSINIDGKNYCIHQDSSVFGEKIETTNPATEIPETSVSSLGKQHRQIPLKEAKAMVKWVMDDKKEKIEKTA